MAFPNPEIYNTIAEIMLREADEARVARINRMEAELADIDIKILAKQKEMEPLQKQKTEKEKQLSQLRKQLAQAEPQRAPLPASQPKGAPVSTAPTAAANPATPAV